MHSSPLVLVPLDPEIEHSLMHLRKSAHGVNHYMAEYQEGVLEHAPRTTLLEHYIPGIYSSPSGIHLPVVIADHFEIKLSTIQTLPIFHRINNENPYMHLDEFEEMYSTMNMTQFSDEALCLKLFPFFLKDHAKHWLNTLPASTVTTWDRMKVKFLK